MKKVLLTRISVTTDESIIARLAQTLAANLRTLSSHISGPFRLSDGWDINCMIGGNEFWVRLKELNGIWAIILESVWDFPCLATKRFKDSEFARLYRRLCTWKNRYQKRIIDAAKQ
jgi:hypothetical protein